MRDGGDVLRLHDWSWTDPPFTAERERASPYRGFQAIKRGDVTRSAHASGTSSEDSATECKYIYVNRCYSEASSGAPLSFFLRLHSLDTF